MKLTQTELLAIVEESAKAVAIDKIADAHAIIAAWYPVSDKRQATIRAHFLNSANDLIIKWSKCL